MKKRLTLKLLFLVLIISTMGYQLSFASDFPSLTKNIPNQFQQDAIPKTIYFNNKTSFEISQELELRLQTEIRRLVEITGTNPEDWKTEYGPESTQVVTGFPGNQLPGGYNFPKGGMIFVQDTGGPSIPVTFSFGDPYGIISVSVDLGQVGSSSAGLIVNIPADNHFYKAKISKNVTVKPWVIYKKNASTGTWYVWQTGHTSNAHSSIASPEMVQ